MQPKHKEYILENINKKSPKEIAQELGLKERKVRKFLERQKAKDRQVDSKKEIKIQIKKSTLFISVGLIVILGFIAYANSLNGKFLWDDDHLVKDNVYIKSWSNIPKIFSEDIAASAGRKYCFYRPLQMLTYMLDYSLWNLNVKGYHFINIILHILVASAIFWLINILYDNWLISLLTSLFFVVHPIHTEVVSYISGRADSLAALFMLLCFIFYIKSLHTKSITFYIPMLLSYILALLSRENSLILPPVLLLYHYSFKERLKAKEFLPILSLAFAYILLRYTLLKFLLSNISYSATLFQRIPGFFVAITNYTRLLLLPFNLHMEYGKRLFDLTHAQAILGILIFISLLIYILRQRKVRGLIFFSLSWFLITFLPSSNLYPINAYMAEHWLYLPSIGCFLILAQGLNYLYKTKKLQTFTIVLTLSLLTFYSYLTVRQNNYWQGPIAFYERTLEYTPDSSRLHNNLGVVYYELGKNQEAVTSYKKAIQLNPDCAKAYYNLGVVYHDLGKNQEAVALCKKAIQLNPDCAEAYYNLGNVYHDLGKNQEAIPLYKKAIRINPDCAEAYYNLGNAYHDLGKNQEAITSYKKAIQLNPDYAKAYNNLGNVYRELGKNQEAIPLYKEAIRINPDCAEAYNNLGVVYRELGKNQEAVTSYKRAIQLNPDCAEIYNNLGNVYHDLGKNQEAVTSYKKAIQLNPDYAKAYNSLSVAYFREKQYKLAIEYCDRARELGFNNSALLKVLKPYRERLIGD